MLNTSLRLKKKNDKKGYYEDESLILAWDLGILFLGIPNL